MPPGFLQQSVIHMSRILAVLSASTLFVSLPVAAADQAFLGYQGAGGVKTTAIPAPGYQGGLAGFLKRHNLVITRSESSCDSKPGVCQVTAYITRAEYPKHRAGDTGAFCGQMALWETPKNNRKAWSAVSGLAAWITTGNAEMALEMIDSKNRSYCLR